MKKLVWMILFFFVYAGLARAETSIPNMTNEQIVAQRCFFWTAYERVKLIKMALKTPYYTVDPITRKTVLEKRSVSSVKQLFDNVRNAVCHICGVEIGKAYGTGRIIGDMIVYYVEVPFLDTWSKEQMDLVMKVVDYEETNPAK
jgi:hypothetical protein